MISIRYLLSALALLGGSALGQTIYVDGSNPSCPGSGTLADPFCNIQDAINASVDGNTIEVAPGTYTGALNLSGKSIGIIGRDGAEVTIINGPGTAAVTATAGEVFGLEGLTIQGGSLSGLNCNGCLARISDTTITGNGGFPFGSGYGGGITNRSGDITLINSSIDGNTSFNDAGAVLSYQGTVTIENSTINGNRGGKAGGVYAVTTNVTINNSTISGNDRFGSSGAGGAFSLQFSASLNITNSTISGNTTTPGYGGAISARGYSSVNVRNSILWGDTNPEISAIPPTASVSFSDVQGGYAGSGNINLDPKFLDVAYGDFRLACDSPCIDAGNNTALPPTDLEGDDRVVDGDSNGTATVDMGSDEFDMLWVVQQPATGLYTFQTTAPPAEAGNLSLLFLSGGNGSGTPGIPVPVSGGQRMHLDIDSLFNLWLNFVGPVGTVPLACPPGATGLIPSTPGYTVYYAGFSIDLTTGQVPSVSPTHSYITQ